MRSVMLIIFLFFAQISIAGQVFDQAQEDVNRQVAVITDKSGKTRIIRYSNLLFQLALQPDAALNPPETGDLKRALQNLIAQSLISLEVENSSIHCFMASDSEIKNEIIKTYQFFRSPAEFEKRLQAIGFESIKDLKFQREIGFRVTIQKWINLGFRSFMIITPEEEENYYRDEFAPNFRNRQPGLILPELQQQRSQIRQILAERKVENQINKFLEFARKRVEISILIDELK